MNTYEEKTQLDEGEAVLTMPRELSAISVSDLAYWFEGILLKARRRTTNKAEPIIASEPAQ